jgi:uncharacterized membrane protein YeaQ/YmgE (transglycosylase-associated protein family)
MPGFFGWIIVGLFAGAIARFLVPGRQPMGCFMTTALGLAGSLVGGAISAFLFGQDPLRPGIHASGMLMSIVGAVIVLAVALRFSRPAGPPV